MKLLYALFLGAALALAKAAPSAPLPPPSAIVVNDTSQSSDPIPTATLSPVLAKVSPAPKRSLLSRSLLAFAGYRGAEGSPLTFKANPVDPDLLYAWSFGDDSVAEGPLVEHAYADDGVYNVVLTVSLADSDEKIRLTTKAVVTNVLPSNVTIGAATQLAAISTPVEFLLSAVDPGQDDLGFLVDFSDGSDPVQVIAKVDPARPGSLLHSASVSHSFPAAGVFDVTVKSVFDDGTGVNVSHVQVQVLSISLDRSAYSTQQGLAVSLSLVPAEAASQVSVAWSLGDGNNATGPAVQHQYRLAGSYPVTAVVTGSSGETVTLAANVQVEYVAPDAYSLSADATLVAQGSEVSFLASAKKPGFESLQFVLDFGDGSEPVTVDAAPGSQSDLSDLVWSGKAAHTYGAAGIYRARLLSAITPYSTVTVATVQVVVTAVAMSPTFSSGKEGQSLDFVAFPEDSTVSYSWSFGDGSAPEPGANVTHTFYESGNWTVSLTATVGSESIVLTGLASISQTLASGFALTTSRRLIPEAGSITITVSADSYSTVPLVFLISVAPKEALDAPEERLILVGSRQDSLSYAASTVWKFDKAGSYLVRLLSATDRGQVVEVAHVEVHVYAVSFAVEGTSYVVEGPENPPASTPEAEPQGLLSAFGRKMLGAWN